MSFLKSMTSILYYIYIYDLHLGFYGRKSVIYNKTTDNRLVGIANLRCRTMFFQPQFFTGNPFIQGGCSKYKILPLEKSG